MQVDSKGTQLYLYVCPFLPQLPSQLGVGSIFFWEMLGFGFPPVSPTSTSILPKETHLSCFLALEKDFNDSRSCPPVFSLPSFYVTKAWAQWWKPLKESSLRDLRRQRKGKGEGWSLSFYRKRRGQSQDGVKAPGHKLPPKVWSHRDG